MPTSQGMRSIAIRVGNPTDAVHVYSDVNKIWLQLRRSVETQTDIGQPSFKAALCLTPAEALAIAGELLTAASKHADAPKTKAPTQLKSTPTTQQPKIAPTLQQPKIASTTQKPKVVPTPQPANQTKPWTPAELDKLAKAYDAMTPLTQIAAKHQRTVKSIAARLRKLGRTVPPQG